MMMVMISLQTAVFWGQYGQCEHFMSVGIDMKKLSASNNIAVNCFGKNAMKSLCAFAVFMFLSYLFLIGTLIKFKDDILGAEPLNEGYASSSSAHIQHGYSANKGSISHNSSANQTRYGGRITLISTITMLIVFVNFDIHRMPSVDI